MIEFVSTAPKKKSYGRFFLNDLFTEAPGDPDDPATGNVDSDDYEPASNTRVINVLPGERTRRLNFDYVPPTALNNDQVTAEPPIEAPPEPTEPTVSDASPDAGDGMPDPNGPVTDPEPIQDPNAATGDPTAPAPEDVGGVDGPEVDPAGSNLDFNDDGQPGDAAPDAVAGDPNAEHRGPGIEYDSTRRYNLFKDFVKLNLALDSYSERLDGILSDNSEKNKVIMMSQKHIKTIQELTKDYMLIRFDSSTYAQSLLFYELMKTTLQVVFDNLERANKKIADIEKTNKKSS